MQCINRNNTLGRNQGTTDARLDMNRFHGLAIVCMAASALWLGFFAGCQGPLVRQQSPEEFAKVLDVELVGDVSAAHAIQPIRVEGVGLVVGLRGTGSDPPPSSLRHELVTEMQRREVKNPNQILADPSTAMVHIAGYLKPGVQKGDLIDLEVEVPLGSETTSLRGGMLLEARLFEVAILGNRKRKGHVLALAKGPIFVDPMGDQEAGDRNGRILGGGVSLKERPLGIVLQPGRESVALSKQIAAAINHRFHTFDRGLKQGVAKPKTDNYVELTVHPRYKDNLPRYFNVLRAMPLQETIAQREERIRLLERQLNDAITSAQAALRLEALGHQGQDALVTGLHSSDREIRFYAAEALAYLDYPDAAPVLGRAAEEIPAFRGRALAALGAMDDPLARDELVRLLDVTSDATRYGAFSALREMNRHDPLVRGRSLQGQFTLHVVPSTGPPLVHLTRSDRAEVVVFGTDQTLLAPLSLRAGALIQLTAHDADQVTVSRFEPGQADQRRHTSTQLDQVIQAIAELGGTYPDVVQALAEAKRIGALPARLQVGSEPKKHGISPTAEAHVVSDRAPLDASEIDQVADDLPEDRSASAGDQDRDAPSSSASKQAEAEEPGRRGTRGFDRIANWFRGDPE